MLTSRLIDGMGGTGIVWYSFPRALGVKFPVWITDNGVVGVGNSFNPRVVFYTPHRWCFFLAYYASGVGVEWWG